MVVIGNSFDLDRAIENQNYAYKCWFNYEKDGNTMRISDADMKKVLEQWSGSKTKWEAKAEQDITEYSIEGDYEWNSAYDDGKNDAKAEATKDTVKENGKTKKGWDGDAKKSIGMRHANYAGATLSTAGAAVSASGAGVNALVAPGTFGAQAITSSAGAAAGAAANEVAAGYTIGNLGQNIAQQGLASNQAMAETTNTLKDGAKSAWVITCPLVLAVGILYEALAPNSRKQRDGLMNLKTLMETGQANMQAASLQMEQSNIEMTNLSTASENNKTKTEEEIAAKQELIKVAQAAYNAIVARVKSGEPLSSTDKTKLNACKGQISALQAEIDALQLASIEFSKVNSEAIASKKTEFDTHAQNIAKEKGTTDYAASFDEATRTGAIVQAVAQGLNVASGTYAAIEAGIFAASGSWLFGATAWAWAWMGMAIAGAGMSAHGVVEQSVIANQVGKEIDVREDAQVTIEETTVDYENKLSNMVAQQEFVDLGIAELSEFEQEEIQLATIPTETSTKNEKKSNTNNSINPFNDNEQDKKKNNNPFV